MYKCECCQSEVGKVVRHHWYEDKNLSKEYSKNICHKCNVILSTDTENNHILPAWDLQVEGYRRYLVDHKYPFRSNKEEMASVNIRLPSSLADWLCRKAKEEERSISGQALYIIKKRLAQIDKRKARTLDRESKERSK